VKASEVTSAHIETYIQKRRSEGVGDLTINGELSTLRAALNHAVTSGLIAKTPVRVKLLRTTRRRIPHLLSPEE